MNVVLILAEAEMEPAPPGGTDDCQDIPVLDAYFHRRLMSELPEGERRGRPDIVHQSLLLCLGSPLNRRGLLRVFVHTREDRVIEVGHDAVIPPNQVEFLCLVGRLFRGEEANGLSMRAVTFRQLVEEIEADRVIVLTPSGDDISLSEALSSGEGTVAVVVGAFPCGDYRGPVYEVADVQVSLGSQLLTVPVVISEVLAAASGK